MKLYNEGLYPGALAVVRFDQDVLARDPDAREMDGHIVRLIEPVTRDDMRKMWEADGDYSNPTPGTWWKVEPDDNVKYEHWWSAERYLHPLPPLDLREVGRQAERVV